MLRVVLADDESKVILLMQKLINWRALGYEVVGVANDGLRALELVGQLQPHLLITDIRMPGCDGLELIRRAKALQPKLHFVIISGYRQFEYAQSALKYGVEDYLLKPLKQEELSGILLRLKDKLGLEAAMEFRLKKSGEHQQEQLIEALRSAAERNQPFLSLAQVEVEYGVPFGEGSYLSALVKPDISRAEEYPDGYRILMQHALEIVRRELEKYAEGCAVALLREGIGILLYQKVYQPVQVKQSFTKIRKEIEQQRDIFLDIRITVCLGSRQTEMEAASQSMREALWLCKDRLCRVQPLRDAETEQIQFEERYQMDPAQKKNIQEAAEYLDEARFEDALADTCRCMMSRNSVNGQMIEDWFHQVVEASLFGMQQSGRVDEAFSRDLEERFWRCSSQKQVHQMLQQQIRQQIGQLKKETAMREMRPILEAKRYMQQHYQEALRLETVSNVVGFNATYFSALFKKETGQNFMDYLTELRISKAKTLLCRDDLSVQDVAELVGYRELKYFSRLFKKITGVSPSDYKKLYK